MIEPRLTKFGIPDDVDCWGTLVWDWFLVQKVKGQGHTNRKCLDACLFL